MYMSINGKQVVHTAGIYAGDSGVFPVQKGDKISLFIGSSGQGTPMAACYFIPPKYANMSPLDPVSDESYLHGQFASVQGANVDTSEFKPLMVNADTIEDVNSGLTVISEAAGTKLTATATGVYNVNFGRFLCDAAISDSAARLVIHKYNAGGNVTESVVDTIGNSGTSTSQWVEGNMSYSILIKKDEYIKLGFYHFNPANVNTSNDNNLALFTIAKL
jgi:hypothetical protein